MFQKVSIVLVVLAITSYCPQTESSAVQKESRFFWLFPGPSQVWIPIPSLNPKPAAPVGGSTACAKKTECIAAGKDKCGTDKKCGADATAVGTDAPTDCYVKAGTCTAPTGVTKECGTALCPA